jgi:hypothetical protein
MQLIVWEYFNGSYREYLIYTFNSDGTPHKSCAVSRRGQGCPSKHVVTLTNGDRTILDKRLGRDMGTAGLYILPKQYHEIKRKRNGLIELSCENHTPSDNLPKHCWFQYDKIRIKWELVDHYVPLRDHGQDASCYVYRPTRIF